MNEIKEIREMTGLSQARFSEKYGIPKRTIGNWETGERIPPDYLVKLLKRCVEFDYKTEEQK